MQAWSVVIGQGSPFKQGEHQNPSDKKPRCDRFRDRREIHVKGSRILERTA